MKFTMSGVAKSFSQGERSLEILKGLSLELEKGEVAAIVGESGSGKSTLLSLIAGFEPCDQGEIKWGEDRVAGWTENDWAKFRKTRIGFVFQSYHLIPYLTAVENVALPLRLLNMDQPEQKAREYLEKLGLKNRLDHFSNQMSGGECQRVAIARALIHQPALILADEPTGSLDQKTGTQVLDFFFAELKDRHQSALIVTHSRDVAARCDKIFDLRDGKLWSHSI